MSEFERDLRDECVCGVAAAMYSGFAFTGSEKKFRKMNVHAAALLCLLFLQKMIAINFFLLKMLLFADRCIFA